MHFIEARRAPFISAAAIFDIDFAPVEEITVVVALIVALIDAVIV